MTHSCDLRVSSPGHEELQDPGKRVVESEDFTWSGDSWLCSKKLKHYPAFSRSGTMISVHSFVLIMAKKKDDYLGYIEDLYEGMKGKKMVKVRWFHDYNEVSGLVPPSDVHVREVFITPYEQHISAESVNDLAIVLAPDHFEKCSALLSEDLPTEVFMCHREYRNGEIKPFSLSNLRGYSTQPILSCLDLDISRPRMEDKSTENGPERQDPNSRCNMENQKLEIGQLEGPNQVVKSKPTGTKPKMKSAGKTTDEIYLPDLQVEGISEADRNIEILCQDSGMRGCWFRCKILKSVHNRLKVQYHDIPDEEGPGRLEEWIAAFKIAAVDTLGMRCPGRPTIRPWPFEGSSGHLFEIGEAADAWWRGGWWEGVVIGYDARSNLQIYFPGESRFMTVEKRNVRVSRDWIRDRWVDVPGKPDILDVLTSVLSPRVNLLPQPALPAAPAPVPGSPDAPAGGAMGSGI